MSQRWYQSGWSPPTAQDRWPPPPLDWGRKLPCGWRVETWRCVRNNTRQQVVHVRNDDGNDAHDCSWTLGSGDVRFGADTAARDQVWRRLPSTSVRCFQITVSRVGRVTVGRAKRNSQSVSCVPTLTDLVDQTTHVKKRQGEGSTRAAHLEQQASTLPLKLPSGPQV